MDTKLHHIVLTVVKLTVIVMSSKRPRLASKDASSCNLLDFFVVKRTVLQSTDEGSYSVAMYCMYPAKYYIVVIKLICM